MKVISIQETSMRSRQPHPFTSKFHVIIVLNVRNDWNFAENPRRIEQVMGRWRKESSTCGGSGLFRTSQWPSIHRPDWTCSAMKLLVLLVLASVVALMNGTSMSAKNPRNLSIFPKFFLCRIPTKVLHTCKKNSCRYLKNWRQEKWKTQIHCQIYKKKMLWIKIENWLNCVKNSRNT